MLSIDFCPQFLTNRLQEGFVLWFVNGAKYSAKDKKKEGQQFWLEDGVLCTQTVKMFNAKNKKTGSHAERMFKMYLETLSRPRGGIQINNRHTSWDQEFSELKDSIKELMRRLDIPTKKKHRKGTYLDQIDEMWADTEIHWHKKRVVRTDVFDAAKSKTAVFKWLIKKFPEAIVVPEFGIGDRYAKSSIVDMAAFDKNKMIFVEIKAENDTFARLEHQLETNMSIADEAWLAIYEGKKIPDLPDRIGLLSINSDGDIKVLKKALKIKQDKKWIGHIWFQEWQSMLSKTGVPIEIKRQRTVETAEVKVQEFLKAKSREFTIDVWRSRFQLEFLWRRGLVDKGDDTGASRKRGWLKEKSLMQKYFDLNFNKDERIKLPSISQ